MTYYCMVLMTSTVSLVTGVSTIAAPFQSALNGRFNEITQQSIAKVFHVEKLKHQILRSLNLTSEPTPTSATSERHPVFSIRPPPLEHRIFTQALPTPFWAEPVDTEDKTSGDQLLFRVNNQEKSKVINRATLVLKLRSTSLGKSKLRPDLPQRDKEYMAKPKGEPAQNRRNKKKNLRLLTRTKQQQQQQNEDKSLSSSNKLPEPGLPPSENVSAKKSKGQDRHNRKKKKRQQHIKVQVQALNEDGKFHRVTVQRVTVNSRAQWIDIQIPASIVARAAQSANQTLVLKVRCKRCHERRIFIESVFPRGRHVHKDARASASEDLNPDRPYLIIKNAEPPPTDPSLVLRRLTRAATAAGDGDDGGGGGGGSGSGSGFCPALGRLGYQTLSCCAERMQVTFRDFGWDHWIVYPPGFSTVVCVGVCAGGSIAPVTEGEGSRTSASSSPGETLTSNCQPNESSALTLVYQRDANTLVVATIPDLINHNCACLAT